MNFLVGVIEGHEPIVFGNTGVFSPVVIPLTKITDPDNPELNEFIQHINKKLDQIENFENSKAYDYLQHLNWNVAETVVRFSKGAFGGPEFNYAYSFPDKEHKILMSLLHAMDANAVLKALDRWNQLKGRETRGNPLLGASASDKKEGIKEIQNMAKKGIGKMAQGTVPVKEKQVVSGPAGRQKSN